MKRFTIYVDHRGCWGDCCGSCGSTDAEQDSDGTYVRWEDVHALVEKWRNYLLLSGDQIPANAMGQLLAELQEVG